MFQHRGAIVRGRSIKWSVDPSFLIVSTLQHSGFMVINFMYFRILALIA
jgi:hypothetical protein